MIRELEGKKRKSVIIAVTASAFGKDEYIQAGMDCYLAKPFKRADLEKNITSSLR